MVLFEKMYRGNMCIMNKILCVLLLSFLCISCSAQIDEGKIELSTLRIGILPDEGKDKLVERYTPLFEYLSQEIGIPYQLIIPKDYDELLSLFHEKKVDFAYFGGFTFMKARMEDDAEPLVMRDVDTRFTSYFLVRSESVGQQLADYKGAQFAFGSDLSTSGHLMPRYFLNEMGIDPEYFFGEISYSGRHDLTAYWVRDGKVELGVANHAVIDKMYEDGRLTKKEVRILYETPPYPDYVWALRPLNNKAFRIKLRNAFLRLEKNDEVGAKILAALDAGSFLPAGVNDFSKLRKVMSEFYSSGRK